jgi:tripartite-type tricarboxylate transporter receptor subunit TctC
MKKLGVMVLGVLLALSLVAVGCGGSAEKPAAAPAPAPITAPQAAAPAPVPEWKPTKPVIFLVGFAPGGGHDLTARILSPILGERWGVPVIVKNLPGADELIMRSEVKNAKPDGHVFGITFMNNAIGAEALGRTRIPYGSIEELTNIGRMTSSDDTFVVGAHKKVKTIEDLRNVELIIDKSSPTAAKEYIVGKAFGFPKSWKAITLANTGSVDQFNQILRGERDTFASDVSTATLLGITQSQRNPVPIFHFGKQRHRLAKQDSLFDVPTVVELGRPELLAFNSARALIGPPNMPPNVLQGVRDAMGQALARPDVKEKMEKLGLVPDWVYGAEWDKLRKDLRDLISANKDEVNKVLGS